MYEWWLDIEPQEVWAYIDNLFTDEEIDFINDESSKTDSYLGQVGTVDQDEQQLLNLDYRNSTISNLKSSDEDNHWIFQRITSAVLSINKQFWNFDINRIETLQHSVYNEGQFYKPHMDSTPSSPSSAVRKISFSILLSDSSDYDGGKLLMVTSNEPVEVGRKKGTIIFFPSYVLHEVTEVTRGTRKALVGWVTGPAFK